MRNEQTGPAIYLRMGQKKTMGSNPKKISASRIPSIFEVGYQSKIDLWVKLMEEEYPGYLEKHGYQKPEEEEIGPQLKFGLLFENTILNYLEKEGHTIIAGREMFFVNGIFTCHVDGIDNGGIGNIREIKTTSSFAYREKWGREMTDEVPPEYYLQVQQQMYLADKDSCIIDVLVFPDSQENMEKLGLLDISEHDKLEIVSTLKKFGLLKRYIVRRDDPTIDKIVWYGNCFWENNVIGKTPPDANSMLDIKKIIRPLCGECLGTPEVIEKCNLYNYINEESSRISKEKAKLAAEICQYMISNCKDNKSGKMIIKDNRGFNIASYGSRLSVSRPRKEFKNEFHKSEK